MKYTFQVPPITPILQKQPSVGNVLARTSSFGSSSSGSPAALTSAGSTVTRQGSQGSLFEQFTSQAKELVRETTRQSSQDGLLAQMDKVNNFKILTKLTENTYNNRQFQFKIQAKEKLTEAEESKIFAPFDKVSPKYRRKLFSITSPHLFTNPPIVSSLCSFYILLTKCILAHKPS